MELFEKKNPLKKVKVTKKMGLVRDRNSTKVEMASLHVTAVDEIIKNRSPIVEIFNLISITVAR